MFNKNFGKSTKEVTVYFKNFDRLVGDDAKCQDMTVYTFTCAAVDHEDAIRQLKMSRQFTTKRFSSKFHRTVTTTRTRRFKVVRVFSGDGVGHCDCGYCKVHPTMSRKVTVLKSRQPRWMMRSFSSNAR